MLPVDRSLSFSFRRPASTTSVSPPSNMSAETNRILAILHTNISEAYALLNHHSEALLHATRAIELRPDSFTPNIQLAIHDIGIGLLDEAFSKCLKDLQINLVNVDAVNLIISRALGFLFAYGSSQNILARIESDVVMQYWRDRDFVVMFQVTLWILLRIRIKEIWGFASLSIPFFIYFK